MIKKWIKMLYFLNKLSFPSLHCMIEGNYLEQHKEVAGGNLYYVDYKCKAFCVAGDSNSPVGRVK